jgi:hypothetical protein
MLAEVLSDKWTYGTVVPGSTIESGRVRVDNAAETAARASVPATMRGVDDRTTSADVTARVIYGDIDVVRLGIQWSCNCKPNEKDELTQIHRGYTMSLQIS